MERLQGPVVDVVVPATSPAAANAVPVLAVPGPGNTPGAAAAGASGGPSGGSGGTGGVGSGSGAIVGPALPGGAGGGVGSGTGSGVSPRGPAAGASAPARPLVLPNLSNLPGPYREPTRRSLADMANEQLRRGKLRDPLAEGVEASRVDDCVRAPGGTPTVSGLLTTPGLLAKALDGRCPK